MKLSRISLACAAAVTLSGNARAQAVKLETTNLMIASGDPGIDLCLRNKHPAGMQTFSAEKTLLMCMARPIHPRRHSICRLKAPR